MIFIKKYAITKKIVLLFSSLLCLFACKKDFNINADYEDFPIIYALFNAEDSLQYVKVYKSYLSDNIYDGAKQWQLSTYLDSIIVYLEEYNKGNLLRTIVFDTTTAIPKDSGLFSYPLQVLYWANVSLNADYVYKLKVYNPYTNKIAEGQTVIPDSINLTQPRQGVQPPFLVNISENTFDIAFRTAQNAVAYQVMAKYYYSEVYADTTLHCKPITWNIGTVQSSEVHTLYRMSSALGSGFFRTIANGISPNENVLKRYTDSIVFEIYSVASDWFNYLLATQPINGINQERMSYTNIIAYDSISKEEKFALGFVSARYLSRITFDDLAIPDSRDSLFNGRFTGHLKFSDIH